MLHKNLYKVSALAAVACVVMSVGFYSVFKKNLLGKCIVQDKVSPTDQVALLNRDYPVLSMVISDELLKNMDEYYTSSLQSIEKYFDLVINEEIEENVVYIRARSMGVSASDCDDSLVSAREYMQKANEAARNDALAKVLDLSAPLMSKAKSYGADAAARAMTDEDKTLAKILNAATPALNAGANHSKSICSKRASAQNAAFSKMIGKVGTVIKTALPYGETAVEEALAKRTASLYRTASELLSGRSLKYKDYYITSSSEEIAIVCGSLDSAEEALDYIRTQYIEDGEIRGDFYLINEPKEEMHEGQYLDAKVSGNSLEQYTLIYYSDDTYYDSQSPVEYLNDYFLKNLGEKLVVNKYTNPESLSHKIVVGKSPYPVSAEYYSQSPDICSYEIRQDGGDLYIMGGSDWAIQYAIDYMIDQYFSKDRNVPKDFYKSGSIYGTRLFEKYEDANLRIMTSNIWDKPCNTAAWKEQGEDCSNNARLKNIAKVYMAYDPDVIALQEMNYYFINYLVDRINESGRHYKVADRYVTGNAYRNFTPIVYNADTVKLLDSSSHIFRYASNSNSKSYTWGYFQEKKTGNRFVVFSTHLWWQSDKSYPKSSYYREKQIAEICNKADELIAKYDCPCFIMGDFNCTSSSKEYKTLATMGYSDCYATATKYSDNSCGKYVCNGKSFSYKVSGSGYSKSIDHIASKNLKESEILTYDYVTPNFYGKLSDHAPLYVDVMLK